MRVTAIRLIGNYGMSLVAAHLECLSQGCEKSEIGFTCVGSYRGGPARGGQKGNEHVSMWSCRIDVRAILNRRNLCSNF